MADVFISYARADRPTVERLALWITTRDCSVWWDRELEAGASYRTRISEELANAKVVFVIWSMTSIRSDWVISEAEKARLSKKLVPFKTGSLDDDRIPLPFGAYSTPWIEDREAVASALASRGLAVANFPRSRWSGRGWFTRVLPFLARPPEATPARKPPTSKMSATGLPEVRRPTVDLPVKTDGAVTYRMAEPRHLHPVTVVAQCLDNQWAPLNLLRRMQRDGVGYAQVKQDRGSAVRRGLIRSLVSARQVVVNRAFLLNNDVLTDCYLDGGERREFETLLSDGAIVPFLFNETSPIEPVNFSTLETSRQWPSVAAASDLTCLRLDWSDDRNRQLIRSQLGQRFHEFAQNLYAVDVPTLASDLQLACDQETSARLAGHLSELARFTFDMFAKKTAAGQAPFITRDDLYRRFVSPDGMPTADGFIARDKPFALEMKQIIDLKYNLNLPDALDRFSLTPGGSLARATLQEVRLMQKRSETIDIREVMRVVANINYERGLQMSQGLPFDQISLRSVLKTRASPAFERYIAVAQSAVPDQSKAIGDQAFFSNPDRAVAEMSKSYCAVVEELALHHDAEMLEWRPRIELQIRFIGSGVSATISKTAGVAETFLSLPEIDQVPAKLDIPILVELCVMNSRSGLVGEQSYGLRLPLLRGKVADLKQAWGDLNTLADGSLTKHFVLNRLLPHQYRSRHAVPSGLEQKDADDD